MSIQTKVNNRIKGKGRGAVFTPQDFLDLGSRASVDQALSRMTSDGTIRRLSRGVYDFPRMRQRSAKLLYPRLTDLAQALAGPRASLQPSGAKAANDLGLSTQVPARAVFLTDGPNRDVRVGQLGVRLKHSSPDSWWARAGQQGMWYRRSSTWVAMRWTTR